MSRWLQRLDAFQQRHRWLGLPIAVNKRFGEHDGTRLSAVVSYYSFFSVFPLLLVFVTVLGIVLDGDPELRQELLDSALAQIPLIGSQLAAEQSPLQGNVLALVIGVVTALWAGMGAIGALQQGLDELGDVPRFARPNFAMKRVRAVAFLVAFGAGIVTSVVLGNVVTFFGAGFVRRCPRAGRHVPRQPVADGGDVQAPAGTSPTDPRAVTGRGGCRRRTRAAAAARELGRPALHRGCQRHLRHVRRRHRPAELVPPREPDRPAVGRAQRRACPRPVTAQLDRIVRTDRRRSAHRSCSTCSGSSATRAWATPSLSARTWARTRSRSAWELGRSAEPGGAAPGRFSSRRRGIRRGR